MKVAFAHYSSPDDISGVSTWLVATVARLRAAGVAVAVHLNHSGGDPAQASILPVLRAAGAEVSIVPRARSLQADARQTLAFLNSWRPSVFLPQCLPAHALAASIAGRQGLPWVFTFHSDDPEYWATARAFPPAAHGGRTVCVSRALAEQVRRSGLDADPLLIPYGVPLPAGRAEFRQAPFRIAYSGRLWTHQKRVELVTEALIQACRRSPHLQAVLLGDGYARGGCEQRVQQAGLADAIRFAGRLEPAALQAELEQCQAILLMSDFEGLPIALLEAMALGVVPVVRGIASGIPELVDHGSTGLLTTEDPLAAADALCRLADDPPLWQRCSEGARQRIWDHYGRERSGAAWLSLLGELDQDAAPHRPLRTAPLPRSRDLDPLLTAPYRPASRPGLKQTLARRRAALLARLKTGVLGRLRVKPGAP